MFGDAIEGCRNEHTQSSHHDIHLPWHPIFLFLRSVSQLFTTIRSWPSLEVKNKQMQ